MNTAEKIRRYRKQAHLTQKDLADKTGLSIASIQGYEQGKYKPKFQNVSKIANVLGISSSKLIDFEDISATDSTNDVPRTKSDRLNDLFDMLNDTGQDKAIDQVEMLTKIDEYTKE